MIPRRKFCQRGVVKIRLLPYNEIENRLDPTPDLLSSIDAYLYPHLYFPSRNVNLMLRVQSLSVFVEARMRISA